MTLLSIVVPVYRVQGYLRECLDSILNQSFTDVEVIAVNDCSPDSSGEILVEYAMRDSRVQVISLERNVGLGEARNIGLDRATGDYVWFVDSDDWLANDCLRAVARRLTDTRPDVMIVDHVRTYWNNGIARSSMVEWFPTPLGAEVFGVRDQPKILRLLHTAWNKVVRREFLVDLGLRFGPGWYEDVSFTFPLLMKASRVTVLERVCVNYRQRRTGAITRTKGERHFEVFPHWHRVFELMDGWGAEVDDLRPLMFERMIWHYLSVLGHHTRVPKQLRRKFFAQMTEDYRRWLPPGGYRVPSGQEGIKHRLVAEGRWRTFSGLRLGRLASDKSRSAVRKVKRRMVSYGRKAAVATRNGLLSAYYRAQLRMPMDESLALYAAYWYRGYSCNPAAIYEKARELAPDIRGVWVVRRDRAASMPPGVDYVVAGTRRYYRALARAKWLINNVNFPDHAKKRPGSVHVQTHHGTPVKMMGLDQQKYPVGAAGMKFPNLLRRSGRWDFSITSNTFSTQMWERAYPCSYEALETGYPRNDRLVNASEQEIAAVRARLGIEPSERVVLYAPTHREHLAGYQPPFDVDEFVAALGGSVRLLMRSHYFHELDRFAPLAASTGQVMDMSAYPSMQDLYLAADVLITDYSSAMFDYATLDRPIVIYAPDWDAYRVSRGVYLDIVAEPPGAVATTFAELVDVFRTGEVEGDAADKARGLFRRRFCALDDGRAAERVVRRVMLGESV